MLPGVCCWAPLPVHAAFSIDDRYVSDSVRLNDSSINRNQGYNRVNMDIIEREDSISLVKDLSTGQLNVTTDERGEITFSQTLEEITVKPKKVKYSKKNNPAVDLMQRVRKAAHQQDPSKEKYFSYDKYEKLLIALNDFKGDSSVSLLGKKADFLMNYVDTSAWTGNRLLDLILKEKRSTRLMSKDPSTDKEITLGFRSVGADEVFNKENMQAIFEDAIREIDIYENDITILQNRFVSPFSVLAADFYKYYITDTLMVGDVECIELSFAPHNPQSMGFNGKIYVETPDDSTVFVRKITMRSPHDINLNYLENLFVNQRFEPDSLGNRKKLYDDVCLELRIAPGTPGFYGRKTTSYNNFSYKKRNDLEEFYDKLGKYFVIDKAYAREVDYWNGARMVPLTAAESRMGNIMKDMRKVPLLFWGEKLLSLLESGYLRTGKPSKVDLGPINTLLSSNSVEGLRIRVGGMTMAPLNPHLFAKGFVAYGTRDRRWKYDLGLEYSFTKKQNHSFEWPRHGVYLSFAYDLDHIGEHYLFTNSDNVFLSLKRKKSELVTYRRLACTGYVLELPNNFSIDFQYRHERQEATRWMPFNNAEGKSIGSFNQGWFSLSLRYAPGEKFIQGRTQRAPINMDAWIFQLTHDFGPKGWLGAAFCLNRTEVSIQKRLWFSAFGYANLIIKAGKIWDSVYYPALLWPNANLSYTIQPESYSLMNPMEFANDKYAALDISYFGNGVLFNRIPLIKRLKLREAVTFKGLMGGLGKRNNPTYNKSLLQFPSDAVCRVMSRTPYMEVGVGIDNIFTVLRVDYVWRLTYLDSAGIDKHGVRVALHFSF